MTRCARSPRPWTYPPHDHHFVLTLPPSILRSNLARLVIINLITLMVLTVTFIVVLRTFASLRQLFQVEVSQQAWIAAKSFTLGKAFVVLESEIHNLHNDYLHDPEGIVVGSKDLLGRFDAIIMEAKTSDNLLRHNHGIEALEEYRQSLALLLESEIQVSKAAMILDLKNRLFLQTLTDIEGQLGQLIMDEVLAGTPATGLLQINALSPFCREQILQARLLIDNAVYTHAPDLLINHTSASQGETNLSSVISVLRQTLSTMTSATPTIARQTSGMLSQLADYWQTMEDFDTALRAAIHYQDKSDTTRDAIISVLNDADQQTVSGLEKISSASSAMLSRATKTIYTVSGMVLLVTVIGGLLVHIIGRQLAYSAQTAEEAKNALRDQIMQLDKEIAGRVRAETELRQLNENLDLIINKRTLDLAMANDELEAFVAAMSHDLRTPLRGIAGFSHALQEDYGSRLDPQGRAYLDRVQEACLRIGTTIDSILELARFSRCILSVKEVDLSAMADSLLAELKRNEPGRLVCTTIAQTPKILADPLLLRSLLEALLANAWKFTQHKAETRIEFDSRVKHGRRIFMVKDNGAGFNMAYGNKLFHPFQRLHSPDQFPGLGIGLALAKRIIKRYHGEIWAEGIEGHGATFSFSLSCPEVKA